MIRLLARYISFLLAGVTILHGGVVQHRYSFNGEGKTAIDSIGNLDGTIIGGATLKREGFVELDGVNDWIELPAGLVSRLKNLTIETWVSWQGPSTSQWQNILLLGNGSSHLMYLTPNAQNKARFAMSNGGPERKAYGTVPIPFDGNIVTHMAATIDGETHTAYLHIDGIFKASVTQVPDLSGFEDTNNFFGKPLNLGFPSFKGRIHEVRILGKTLTQDKVKESFDLGPNRLLGPVINLFQADREIVRSNSAVILTWDISDGSSVTIEPGVVSDAANTGSATVNVSETTSFYLTATDEDDTRSSKITVVVDDRAILLDNVTIAENESVGSIVGHFSIIDLGEGNTPTFALTDEAQHPDNAAFTIEGIQLKTAGALDHENKANYAINVQGTDPDGLSMEQSFTINVTDANDPPTAIIISRDTIPENQEKRYHVGSLSAIDQDDEESHSFQLFDNVGGSPNHNDFFTLTNNSEVHTLVPLDFEALPSLTISVRVIDKDGASLMQDIPITVENLNDEGPTDINLDPATVDENSPKNTEVGMLSTVDPDDPTLVPTVSMVQLFQTASYVDTGQTIPVNGEDKKLYKVAFHAMPAVTLWNPTDRKILNRQATVVLWRNTHPNNGGGYRNQCAGNYIRFDGLNDRFYLPLRFKHRLSLKIPKIQLQPGESKIYTPTGHQEYDPYNGINELSEGWRAGHSFYSFNYTKSHTSLDWPESDDFSVSELTNLGNTGVYKDESSLNLFTIDTTIKLRFFLYSSRKLGFSYYTRIIPEDLMLPKGQTTALPFEGWHNDMTGYPGNHIFRKRTGTGTDFNPAIFDPLDKESNIIDPDVLTGETEDVEKLKVAVGRRYYMDIHESGTPGIIGYSQEQFGAVPPIFKPEIKFSGIHAGDLRGVRIHDGKYYISTIDSIRTYNEDLVPEPVRNLYLNHTATYAYTLVNGTGGEDNNLFKVSGDRIILNEPLDFEARESYHIRVRSTDEGGAFIEKEFTVTEPPGDTPFNNWLKDKYGYKADWLLLADTDSDGVSNLLEYAFGLDPTKPQSNRLAEFSQDPDKDEITFRYTLPRLRTDVDIRLQTCKQLGQDWTDLDPANPGEISVIISVDGDFETCQVTFSRNGPLQFLRFVVEQK
jgi:hypothetical protein